MGNEIKNIDIPANESKEIKKKYEGVCSKWHENDKYYPQVLLDECLYKLLWVV